MQKNEKNIYIYVAGIQTSCSFPCLAQYVQYQGAGLNVTLFMATVDCKGGTS